MRELNKEKQDTFLGKKIVRWSTLGEVRVLLESYLLCCLIPVLLYILPEWIMVSNGRVHREGLVDYSMGLGAILFAPIFETIFIFVPILEICRFFKVNFMLLLFFVFL